MPATLEGLASDLSIPAVRRAPAVPALLVASALVLAAAVLFGGGSADARLAWIGGAAVAVSAVAIVVLPVPRLGRSGFALAALVAALVAWQGISIVWSIQPDRSWDVVNRGFAYLALLFVGVAVGAAARRAAPATAATLAVVFGAAVVWALTGKVIPALGPDVARVARLRAPVDYWNALALLVAMSLPLWLWLAAPPARRRPLRAIACAAIALSVVALALTASRGGILVATLAAAAWLALVRPRVESGLALLAGGVPGALVGAWALTRPALSDAGPMARGRDGAILGVLLAAAAVFAAAAGTRILPAPAERRRALGVALGVAALGLAVGAVATVTVHVGGPREFLQQFRDPGEQANAGGRIASVSASSRWIWWKEAARIWRDHPFEGTGAGTFETARKPIRKGTASPIEPHDLPLGALSETGVVGFALLLGAIAAAAAVAVGALRRLEADERLAAAALIAASVAYLGHSLIDMGYEFVAVTAPVLVALGVLTAAGRPPAGARLRPLPALAVAALAATVLASLASPRLAARRTSEALDAILDGRPARAASLARDAHVLNPLAVEPLFREAAAEQQLGRPADARRLYEQAVDLQPENPETWYWLGEFEWQVAGDAKTGVRYLERSWLLDPFGPAQHDLEAAKRDAAKP